MSTDDEATRRREDLQEGWTAPAAPEGGQAAPPPAPAVGAQGPPPPAPPVAAPPAAPEAAYGGPTPPAQPYAAPAPGGGYAAPPPAPGGAYAGYGQPGGQYLSPWGEYAHWGLRVGASLIDGLLSLIGMLFYVAGIPFLVAGLPDRQYDYQSGTYVDVGDTNAGLVTVGVILIVLGALVMLAINIWNRWIRQGRTGQTVGKKVLGITLVDERTGQPIGALMCFVRDIVHVLDGFFYLGYLWPLWDPKRQTFADKILNTIVVRVR